jgi:hypothetical protein
MTWPSWIEEIKTRYLADEASVFLLHGAIRGTRWDVDGEALDCTEILVKFLGRTRPVVGVVTEAKGLSFSGIGDLGMFERLVASVEMVEGTPTTLSNKVPTEALGRVWLALASTGSDQAYIVADIEKILPGHRKRVDELGAGAPALWDWCDHARIRASNNIVLLLTPTLEAVRQEVVDAASAIVVDEAPTLAEVGTEVLAAPDPVVVARSDAEAEIEAFLESRSTHADTSLPPETAATEGLVDALQTTLTAHPVSTWEQRLPVMDAIARILADRIPLQIGVIDLSIDEEGQVVATGKGADWFLERWGADIALDAAAGMLLNELTVPDGADFIETPQDLSATAVKALNRRIDKIVASVV